MSKLEGVGMHIGEPEKVTEEPKPIKVPKFVPNPRIPMEPIKIPEKVPVPMKVR
jgi:hypothetical protein